MQLTAESQVAQVKARLLPLPPWLSALEWLIELLPRQLAGIELFPNEDIEVIDKSRGEYKAAGKAAGFEMVFRQSEPQSGWYYLEAVIVRGTGSREAGIRVDLQEGSGASITIPVPATLRGSVREVFFLPANIKSLHWIPASTQGFFSQSQLLIHKITHLESILRRLYRVLAYRWRDRRNFQNSYSDLNFMDSILKLQVEYERLAQLRIARLGGNDYNTFIVYNDTLSISGIRRINRRIRKFSQRPLISILLAMMDTDKDQFKLTCEALKHQLYDNWELIVSSAEKNDLAHQVCRLIDTYNDKRFKIISLEGGNVTAIETAVLLNHALHAARGEWILQIDSGDRLPGHALFHYVEACNQYPDTQFIYGDDDNINHDGKRFNPRFKPDWNPDFFTSYDYIGHPALYRRDRLIELGGFATGYAGAEGYELRLRYLKMVQEAQIRHVHRVLYHKHATTNRISDTRSMHAAGRRALQQHLNGTGATVDDGFCPQLYRVRYPVPSPGPLVSIVIPTRDKVDLLTACVNSIRNKTDYSSWEVLIVDNNSAQQETLAYFQTLESDKRIRILPYNKPFNYSSINNYAVEHAKGEIIVLLNNDVEAISSGWLTEMVSHAIRPEIGAVGAKLLYPDGNIQHAGVILGIGGVAAHMHRFMAGDAPGYCYRAVVTQNLSAVTGACLAVRKKLFQEVGGLNEDHLRVAFNDIDLCLKLLDAGYKNLYTPYALLYHHESITRGADDTPEKKAIYDREYAYMRRSWGDKLITDKAYNNNLSLENEYFIPRI